MLEKWRKHRFLFEELVKRDFKAKYKRTVLGMAWSVLSPLLMLLVMRLVFTRFFGRGMEHYTTYLFCGNLMFSYFNESTGQGMTSLMGNAGIFTKVNVPKYLFLFSKNVQTLINFLIPSGSGQAAATMPIMAPLADMLGITRQVACLAFQFGDGLSNILWPTAGIVIICGLGDIPYDRWLKWFGKLFLILLLAQMALLQAAIVIGL